MSYNPNFYNYALGAAALGAGRVVSAYRGSGPGVSLPTSYARSMVVSKKRRGLKRRSFADRVRRLAPYKHNTLADSTVTNAMTHNTIYTTNLTAKITQGDTNQDRNGDSLVLAAVKVSGIIHTPTTSGAYNYRVLLLYSGEEYNVTASAAGLANTEIFLPNGGGSFMTRAIINPKTCTVLHDQMYDVNSLVTATSDNITCNFKVNLKGKFPYQSSGSVFGKNRNIYLVVISAVVGGTSGVTASGTYFLNTDVIFQDS